jgi:hypothetical protein
MLLCLDRPHRLAFILAVIFQVSSVEGAAILEISEAAFRQRLSRARRALRSFMERRCGLLNTDADCRCARQVEPARRSGRLDPEHLVYVNHPIQETALSPQETAAARAEIVGLGTVAGIFRSHPAYRAPDSFVAAVRELVNGGQLRVLSDDY